MEGIRTAWIVAEGARSRGRLIAGAKALGAQVSCVVMGSEDDARRAALQGADTVYHAGSLSPARRASACIDIVAQAIDKHMPDLVLFEKSPDGLLLAARIAARRGQSAATNLCAIRNEDGLEMDQMVFGGAAVRTIRPRKSPVIAVAPAHIFPDDSLEGEGVVVDLTESAPDAAGPTCTGLSDRKAASVDLSNTKRIVCIGRGVSTPEGLNVASELATLLDAELACTRPVSEVYGLLETERYVGVTGIVFKPELLVSIGVSGQIQHMVGCNQAGTILAINKDKGARIFPQVDLGLVADYRSVVPKVIDQLKA